MDVTIYTILLLLTEMYIGHCVCKHCYQENQTFVRLEKRELVNQK